MQQKALLYFHLTVVNMYKYYKSHFPDYHFTEIAHFNKQCYLSSHLKL